MVLAERSQKSVAPLCALGVAKVVQIITPIFQSGHDRNVVVPVTHCPQHNFGNTSSKNTNTHTHIHTRTHTLPCSKHSQHGHLRGIDMSCLLVPANHTCSLFSREPVTRMQANIVTELQDYRQ